MWNLSQAIELARKINAVLYKDFYHVALGGSCLIKGQSTKDCDIFVYPHSTQKQKDHDLLLGRLFVELGIKTIQLRKHEYDGKEVWHCELDSKRIDIFFVT